MTHQDKKIIIEGETIAPEISEEKLQEIRVRIGTLLKMESVSFLLGAGASAECGGPLLGSIPIEIEERLLNQGVESDKVARWLRVFYLAAHYSMNGRDNQQVQVPILDAQIQDRKKLKEKPRIPANYEKILTQLHLWHAVLQKEGICLIHDNKAQNLQFNLEEKDVRDAIRYATCSLVAQCILPAESNQKDKPSDPHQKGNPSDPLGTHKLFLRKLLARPINLRRVHIFTLNYDTLIEQAADAEGIILLDGFVGTQRRVFRPEVYEQDIYFPGETTEGRVHRFDRLLHLYKLHGSITWISSEPTPKNPYGVESLSLSSSSAFSSFPSDEIFERCIDDSNPSEKQRLIYPTPTKYGETLGMPYAELFRRFAASVVRPQSVLFVIGYGFGDEHVNKIIWQALAIPSFILVIVDPSPSSPFVNMLLNQNDQRIWLFSGKDAGKFSSFVEQFLPELHADQIREKALETYRKLSGKF